MRRAGRGVTETELAILHVLWERGTANRRDVTDALYPAGGPAHYTTVQKLLDRLQAKGHVRRHRKEGVVYFTARTGREELIGRRLQEVAEQLCGGSLTPLLMNLVRAGPLTATDLAELQALIKQLKDQAKPRGKSR